MPDVFQIAEAMPTDDPWHVLLVDDDPLVHRVARLTLRALRYRDRPLLVHEARNLQQAREHIARHPHIAVAVIDVMLDGQPAGLQLVNHIRNELGNRLMRIVVSTGQCSLAPEFATIHDHEINAYLDKGQTDSARLCGAILTGLRGFCEVDHLQGALRHVSRLALTDALTGLKNRMALGTAFRQVVNDARRSTSSLALVFIDLDDFKRVNDQEGHGRGDQLLQAVGNAILATSREEDQGFRYGGDEFVVVLPNCDARQARSQYLPRLTDCLARLGVAASFGVAEVAPPSYLGMEDAIRAADRDMYEAKQRRKFGRRLRDDSPLPEPPNRLAVAQPGLQVVWSRN
jgi:diguanylate cyclase (GGDEF)-like protein